MIQLRRIEKVILGYFVTTVFGLFLALGFLYYRSYTIPYEINQVVISFLIAEGIKEFLIKEQNGHPMPRFSRDGITSSFPFQVASYFMAVLGGGLYGSLAIFFFHNLQGLEFAYIFIGLSFVSFPLIFLRFHLKYLRKEKVLTQDNRNSRKNHLVILLIFLLLIGVVLTTIGTIELYYYSSNNAVIDRLEPLTTGMAYGWTSQTGVNFDNPEIGIIPAVNNSGLTMLYFYFEGSIYINQTFKFGFISPYIPTSNMTLLGNTGNWSVETVGNEASIIVFSYTPHLNGTNLGNFFYGNAEFFFPSSNLIYRYDRGQYSYVFPFGTGLSANVSQVFLNNAQEDNQYYFPIGHQNVQFLINIPLTFTISSSLIQPYRIIAYNPYGYGDSNTMKQIQYTINSTTELELNVVNNNAVDRFQQMETYGLFFLGIGLPLMVSMMVELYRTLKI